jgi:hypothetical protein
MAINKSDKDQEFQKNFPFISCIKCNDDEYIGIILNLDNNVTSIYDYSIIRSEIEKQAFLELGDVWWWESNRKIPINIFLKLEMTMFRPYIKTFNSKDVTLMFGPSVNLSEIAEKRIKRKSIQLVRNPRKKI